jgi:hypothetical protein
MRSALFFCAIKGKEKGKKKGKEKGKKRCQDPLILPGHGERGKEKVSGPFNLAGSWEDLIAPP